MTEKDPGLPSNNGEVIEPILSDGFVEVELALNGVELANRQRAAAYATPGVAEPFMARTPNAVVGRTKPPTKHDSVDRFNHGR